MNVVIESLVINNVFDTPDITLEVHILSNIRKSRSSIIRQNVLLLLNSSRTDFNGVHVQLGSPLWWIV